MSFDLTTSELDNHPIIRTMLCAWSIGCVQPMFEVPALFQLKLCRCVITMCNAQRLWCAVCTCARLMMLYHLPVSIQHCSFNEKER